MRSYSQAFFAKIMPFIGIGIFLVFIIIAFIFLSSVLLIGAAIGFVLFVIAFIKQKFFSQPEKKSEIVVKKQSRTFDNDEFK